MNEPRDFRGIPWGANFQAVNGMIIYDQDMGGRLKYCTRASDLKKIGNAEIEVIVYSFFDDRFYDVQIIANGWDNTQALLESIVPELGTNYEFIDVRTHKLYSWEGETVDVCCAYNKPSDKVELVYSFKPIKSELLASEGVPFLMFSIQPTSVVAA